MPVTAPLVPDEPVTPPGRVGQLSGPAAATGPYQAAPAAVLRARPPEAAPGAIRILERGARSGRLIHLEELPARAGRRVDWPSWVPRQLTGALELAGVPGPWAHQAAAAQLAHGGRSVIISTGTASGKSLGYLLPALTGVMDGGTALYLAPTRALAADQLRAVQALGIPGVRAAVLDGDTDRK